MRYTGWRGITPPLVHAVQGGLAGGKQTLAEELGVPLDSVTVHVPGHGAIL